MDSFMYVCLDSYRKTHFHFSWVPKLFKTSGRKVPTTYKVIYIHSGPNPAIQQHILVWAY